MRSKNSFKTSLEYNKALAAEAATLVESPAPVSLKLASACFQRVYAGENVSTSMGTCELAPECTFEVDKYEGQNGECLVRIAGVTK